MKPCTTRQALQSDQVSKRFQSQTIRSVMHQGHHSAMPRMSQWIPVFCLHRTWKLCKPCATRQALQSDQVSRSFQSQTIRSVMHQGHHAANGFQCFACTEPGNYASFKAMYHTTGLAVRSGLQKLSVTDYQVCDASRTSLHHATHEPRDSRFLVAQNLETMQTMCNSTGLAVRSGLQKLSVTDCQVCDASRTSLRHATHEPMDSSVLLAQKLEAMQTMCNTTSLAVRSGLPKLSVTDYQVCDASRTSLHHATHEPMDSKFLVAQNLEAMQTMCNSTCLAVRSGLQKLSVTDCQVCDASRASLCHAMHEPINSSALLSQELETMQTMCNRTGLAVRSGLQKLSVTDYQVCDASRTSLRHATHEPMDSSVLLAQKLEAMQTMCNTTSLAVRSGLQQLSVTDYQVCDASRTSLRHATHEPMDSKFLVAQNLEAMQTMCNSTCLEVRSGLQKLSVTDCQVCDASRTSLCHAMHEPINSSVLLAQKLETMQTMCNTTSLAVRSGLQKLSVTDYQVCDASRTSLCDV